MQRRNKVGGILDRRFGENDPSMAPEDKMLERFTQEKLRRHKNSSAFDLEDEDEPGELTHMGQSLSLDGPTLADDFDEEGLALSDADDRPSDTENNPRKRRCESLSEEPGDDVFDIDGQPERKKTKQEVMKEVIAKSKLYKYERQAAKDEDEDLREELDKEMGDIHALLRGFTRPTAPKPLDLAGMNPDRAALLNGAEKLKFEKEYDLRLRQLAQDKKSKPTERTKTEEETLAEESRRLRELEAKRLRRMQGEPEEEDKEDRDKAEARMNEVSEDEDEDFGLGTGIKARKYASELGVEDEDDFIIDDDLVASDSDVEASDDDVSSGGGESTTGGEDTEVLHGLLTIEDSKRPEFLTGANGPIHEVELLAESGVNGDLAYTFSCPQSHVEMLEITKEVVVQDLPTVVRRIRALYDSRLKSENKGKLGKFTVALIDHVSYLANQSTLPPFDVLENLVRHIQSLAKIYPIEVANAFRKHLANQNDIRALTPTSGDLILLTAIGSIFPTSDHFHQVVTPAMLSMARYIGQKIPHTLSEYATGLYMISLCLQYQRLSKRYVPEVMGFLLNTICALCPKRPPTIPQTFAYHESKLGRVDNCPNIQTRNLAFSDTKSQVLEWQEENVLRATLVETSIKLINVATDTWTGKPAFQEVFDPALTILRHLGSKTCHERLPSSTQVGFINLL
jgi:nucleolar protein 14